jgi:hypothetical protein
VIGRERKETKEKGKARRGTGVQKLQREGDIGVTTQTRPGILAESQTALNLSFNRPTRISPGPGCHRL